MQIIIWTSNSDIVDLRQITTTCSATRNILVSMDKFAEPLRSRSPELGILPGAGSGAKKKSEGAGTQSLKFRIGAGAMAI